MRRIPAKAVLQKAEAIFQATRTEPGDSNGLDRVDLLTGLIHLDTWATQFWEAFFWPEWTIVEKRQFRQNWSSASTYGAPTATTAVELYHVRSGKYVQSLHAANTGNAPFDAAGNENSAHWAESLSSYTADYDFASGLHVAIGDKVRNPDDDRIYQAHTAHTTTATFDGTKFGILTPFIRSIAREQSWESSAIAAVKRVTEQDPRVIPSTPEIEVDLVGDDIIVYGRAQIVYVRFRKRPPASGWRGTIYSATATYAADDVAYADSPGDVYRSLAGGNVGNAVTDTTKWERVDFPHVLRDCTAHAIAAQWLKADGETDLARAMERTALALAEAEFDKVERQQGQSGRIPMRMAV